MSLWGSILSKVAQVGISLLSQYAEPSANSDSLSIPNTQIGNITYTLDPETNKIYATNFDLGSTETSISYSAMMVNSLRSFRLYHLERAMKLPLTSKTSPLENWPLCHPL